MANARFEQLKTIAKGTAGALVAWFRRYRPWVYTGLTVISILLIVWARFGFTFEVAQFFAAECGEDFTCPGTQVCDSAGHDCVPCDDPDASESCPEESETSTVDRTALGGCAVAAHPTRNCCLDPGNVSCQGDDRFQHYNAGANWAGCNGEVIETCEYGCEGAPNAVCSAAPAQEPASDAEETTGQETGQEQQQVAIVTDTDAEADATPTPLPAVCAPASQTVLPGDVTLEASDGTGTYAWFTEVEGNAIFGEGETFTFTLSEPGTYYVFLGSAESDFADEPDPETVEFGVCEIIVVEEGIACTADVRECSDGTFVARVPPTCEFEACPDASTVPTSLFLSGEIRNFSEAGIYAPSTTTRPAQELQIRAALFPQGTSGEIRNGLVRALLPDTVSYIPGTTFIEDQPTSVNTIVTGGLALGTFEGETAVSFRVRVKESSQLPSGTLTSQIGLSAQGDNVGNVTDNVTFVIDNAAVARQVGQVQTGPGDTTLLALMAAALLTLLYVSYTYTHVYRSREVGGIAKRKNPLDFK